MPGIYFAGTIGQGAAGLKKHGLPANSGAVHGARYNARRPRPAHRGDPVRRSAAGRPAIAPGGLVDRLLEELSTRPELWHQKAYLARVVSLDADGGLRDEGIQPLADVRRRGRPGRGRVAVTLEADGTGAIYPVVYVRTGRAQSRR